MLRRLLKSQIKRDLILCIFSGILLSFSFPNANIWICAWFGFIPLFLAITGKPRKNAFLLTYLTGVIFWAGTIYWLVHVTLLGTVLLILYLALYFAVFGLIISRFYLLHTNYCILSIPSIWVLLEYFRSHLLTGFPWALLGYSQSLNLPVIQFADITGSWGVSFLVMMVNVVLFKFAKSNLASIRLKQSHKVSDAIRQSIIPIFCLILVLAYGYYKLNLKPRTQNLEPLRISLIQGNIPQELKWKPMARSFIINKYFSLSHNASKENPDLIIWPEAALPYLLGEDPEDFKNLAVSIRGLETPLLLGAVTVRNNLYYNSALLFSSEGKLLQAYDKVHLVPFGEYIPLKNIFPFLETIAPIGDIARGKEYTILKIQNQKSRIQNSLGVLICFEDLFPDISREFAKRGIDCLVNITNDAWYLKTSAAAQHLQASVFRAVENRLNLIRVANTGITGFISPRGMLVFSVRDNSGNNIFIDGVLTEEVKLAKPELTFYTRYGDVFMILCCLILLYGIISRPRKV